MSYKQRKFQEFAGMHVSVLIGNSGQHRTEQHPLLTPYTTCICLLPISSLTWKKVFEIFSFSLSLRKLTEETQEDEP